MVDAARGEGKRWRQRVEAKGEGKRWRPKVRPKVRPKMKTKGEGQMGGLLWTYLAATDGEWWWGEAKAKKKVYELPWF